MKALLYTGLVIAMGVVSYKLAEMSVKKSKKCYKDCQGNKHKY